MKRIRFGLAPRIALFAAAMLLALAGTVLFLALRQQRDLIVEYSLQEVQGKLDPVERKTEEIRYYGSLLEELRGVKDYFREDSDSDEAWKYFDRDQYESMEGRLRASMSSETNPLSEASFKQMQYYATFVDQARRQVSKADKKEQVEQILSNYTQVGRALDWLILQQIGYRDTLRSTFEGLDQSRYRIQTVGIFFQAYFDTSLLSPGRDLDFDISRIQQELSGDLDSDRRSALYSTLQELYQRRYRLNRLGNPEINLLPVGTDEGIRATLDVVRNEFYQGKPSIDTHHEEFTRDSNQYLVSVRTLFMKPAISQRARLVREALESNDSQAWKRYLAREKEIIAEQEKLVERMGSIRASEENQKQYALMRNAEFQDLYKRYFALQEDKQKALQESMALSKAQDRQSLEGLQGQLKDVEAAIEETRARIKELGDEIQSANAAPAAEKAGENQAPDDNPVLNLKAQIEDQQKSLEALQKQIPLLKNQIAELFPRSERIGDAFMHLSDSMLMDDAVLDFNYDPTAYFSYEGSAANRKIKQQKWAALRLWIKTACSETSSCANVYLPYLAGNGQWVRPRRALEDLMWTYDTTPSDALALRAMTENTAAFTRIFSDRSQIDARLQKERHRLVDMAISIGIRMVLVSLLIALFFVRRIQSIIDSAQAVGAGNLNTVFTYPGRDELGNLADTLNQMTRDLRHRESMIQELSAAEQIQSQLLPRSLPERFTDGLSFGYLYRASSGVGGDYFDFIEIDNDRLAFCMADVTGHGPGPAMIMAMMRSHLHSLIHLGQTSVRDILIDLNDRLYSETPAYVFITMFLGVYNRNSQTIEFGSAGHNRGLLFRYASDEVEVLPAGGLPLGLEDAETFASVLELHKVTLEKGDLFFQYTDGINEAANAAGDQFGTGRIEKILKASGKKKPETIMTSMTSNLEAFTGRKVMKDGPTELSDDIAMIAFRRVR
ncbi:MAG: SpoIIE family protein phosphatase [Leptospiraceae bacterium]|nr:SpoIIE family protein phosphatase [Leptospiraceae bacterium]